MTKYMSLERDAGVEDTIQSWHLRARYREKVWHTKHAPGLESR